MARRKLKQPTPKIEKPVKKEKPKKKPEETIAATGGFMFAGAYVLFTGEIPESLGGWAKFVGLFVLVMMIIYIIAFNGKRIYLKKKQAKLEEENPIVVDVKKNKKK